MPDMTLAEIFETIERTRLKQAPANNLTNQLREAIKTSGERQSELARGSGVSSSTISRFMAGKCRLSSTAVDRLTQHLQLRLVPLREWKKRDKIYVLWKGGNL